MSTHCHCQNPHHTKQHQKSNKQDNYNHLIHLFQNNFILPYKILYLLDPKQADHFKSRNKSQGCCSSNRITIADEQLTKTEKKLKQMIGYSSLYSEMDLLLCSCFQKFNNIVNSGKKDNLEVNNEVEKYLLDKVMSQSINNQIFMKLSQQIKKETLSNNKEIGLWATPATWYQKYPTIKLQFLPNPFIGELLSNSKSVIAKYTSNQEQLHRQLLLLQKDGKFQESTWIENNCSKLMNNPERFAQIKNSQGDYLFKHLRELMIKISSIPFQLNAKANLFCTVSPNYHIFYCKNGFKSSSQKGQLKYTLIVNIGNKATINFGTTKIQMESLSLLAFANDSLYSIQCNGKQTFILCNYIGCVRAG